MKAVLILVFCLFSFGQSEEACNSHATSCGSCIQLLGCGWDIASDLQSSESRCRPSSGSKPENLYSPSSAMTILEQKPVSQEVAVSPQKAEITLRLHEPILFMVNFNDTDAFPPQRLADILVEYTRDQPKEIQAKIEAISCPKDPNKRKQNLRLTTYQSNQTLSLELNILCSCPREEQEPTKTI